MFPMFVAKLEFRNAHRLADIHQRNMEKFDGHFCIFLEARKESSANSDSLAAGHGAMQAYNCAFSHPANIRGCFN